MEETLRVKIVFDTAQANSNLSNLSKETGKITGSTDSANTAAQKLEKTFNSLGVRGLKISGIATGVKSIGDLFKSATVATSKFLATQKLVINNFNKLGAAAKVASHSAMQTINAMNTRLQAGNMSNTAQLKQSLAQLQASRSKFAKRLFSAQDWRDMNYHLRQMDKALNAGNIVKYQKHFKALSDTLIEGFKKPVTLIDSIKMGLNKLVNLLKNIVKIALTAAAAIAAIAAVVLVKLAFSVSKVGDEIDKNSQKLGLSTNAYQKWAYILERCGLEVSNLKTAMRQLYRNSQGNNAEFFKQLGIQTEGVSKETLFENSVEALQKIENSAERTRMAYKLFGNASAELSPLLNMNAAEVARLSYQYDLLGATMSGKVIRASVNMRDAMTDLKAAFQGLKNTLGSILMPIITNIIIRLTVLFAKINMILQALFDIEIEYESVAESTETVTQQTEATTQAVQRLKTLISGFDELNIFPSQNQSGDLQGLIDELGDLDWSGVPTIGEILPAWAIEDLENFRDNILPGIVQKIQDIIDKFNELKENFRLWNEGESDDPLSRFINWWWDILGLPEIDWDSYGFHDFFEDIKTELMSPTFEDNSFLSFLNTLIDFNWDNLFGDVDWENPFSLESLFGENLAHLIETGEWDWSQTGIGRFFESLKQEIENIGAAFRGEIEGETILEKLSAALGRFFRGIGQEFENMGKAFRGEIEGETILEKLAGWVGKAIRAIGNWNIFKKSWWEGKWQNIKDAWNNSKLKKFFTDAWGGIKTFFGGIANWNIWKKEWWSQKWQNIKTWWNNSKLKKFFEDGWNGIKNFFNGIKDWNIFKKEWWSTKWENIKTWWTNSKIKKFFDDAWSGIKGVFTNIGNWNIFKKEWWSGKWKTIKDAWNNSFIKKFFTTAWTSIQEWFNKNVATKFTKDYWQNKFQKIKDGFNGLLLVKFFKNGWQGVKDWWNEKVKPVFTKDWWKNKFQKIKDGFNELSIVKFFKGIWENIKTWFNENVKTKFTADYWKQKFEKIKTGLENSALVQTISTKWAAIKKWFSDNISGIFTKEYWQGKWDKIKDGLANSTIIQTVITKWNAVKKWWNDNVKGIFTKEWWQTKWNKIKEGLEAINLGNVFKGIMNGIIGGFETAVNRIIDSVTGPVRLLLVALGVLGEDFQMPHLSIPRLARGGVIDEATVALVGEYQGASSNPEIITPESKMREVFETSNGELVNVLVQGFRQIITAIEDNKTEVSLDGNQLLKSVSKANRQYRTMTGSSMI